MSDDPSGLNHKAYGEARGAIADGDLLLWRGRGLIAIAGRGPWCHAELASWWNGDLFSLGMVRCGGGRAVLLSNLVRRQPGRIDVFRARRDRWPEWRPGLAVRAMRRLCGRQYGSWGLWRAAMLHLPVVRWFARPATDDEAENGSGPMFCSQAVAYACRTAGVDPVPGLADRITEPADLARSAFFRYWATLTE